MIPASRAHRIVTALAVVVTFGAGAISALDVGSWATRHALSNFGRPPELGLLAAAVALIGGGWLVWPAARERRAVAQCATLLLLVATLLGARFVPNDEALRLTLVACALWTAAPWVSMARASSRIAIAALVLAVPALITTQFPHGGLLWITHIVPMAALAVCLPATFTRVRAPALVLVGSAAAAGLVSATSYPIAAEALDLPLSALFDTRLTVLGLHPNLAVPLLAVAATLAMAALLAPGRRMLVALFLAVLAATLLGVGSRTGYLVTGLGVGLFLAWSWASRRETLTRWARGAWIAVIAALLVGLLVPATTWTTSTITSSSSSMASKAVTFRSAMWELGRDSWGASPVLGHGPGTLYEQAAVARPGRYDGMPKDDHPHSIVLLVGGALGVPGLIALALLFAWTVRPPRTGHGEAALASAAVALWAANAIDLGGALNTLYPSLAFVLLGLRDVDTDEAPTADAPLPLRAAGVIALVAISALGITLAFQRHTVRDVTQQLADFTPDTEADALDEALARAASLVPSDPHPHWMRAQLASKAGHLDEARMHIEAARERAPRMAHFAHELAMALWADGGAPEDIDAALGGAIALDAHGREAWRRHSDRARVAAARGAVDDARDALVSALLLNPEAAAEIEIGSIGGERLFLPHGPRGARVPVKDVLADLAAQRTQWGTTDPSYARRFALREVEVLRAIGAYDEADARAQAIQGDAAPPSAFYELLMRGRSSGAAGKHDEAVAHFVESNVLFLQAPESVVPGQLNGIILTEELVQRSLSDGLDAAVFEERSALAPGAVGDLRFETPSYRRWTDARQRVAERTGDVDAATHLHDALTYLDG